MCTKDGLEVRGFNHLRNMFANQKTFLISAFRNKVTYEGSDSESDDIAPMRPELRRGPSRRNSDPIMTRRKSPRVPSRAHSDQGHITPPTDEMGGTDPIKVSIKGERKMFFPPSDGYRKIIARYFFASFYWK